MSSSDENLINLNAAFIVLSSEATRKQRKLKWLTNTSLQVRVGPISLAHLKQLWNPAGWTTMV